MKKIALVISTESYMQNWANTQGSAFGWMGVCNLAGIPYDTLTADGFVQADLSMYGALILIQMFSVNPALAKDISIKLNSYKGSLLLDGGLDNAVNTGFDDAIRLEKSSACGNEFYRVAVEDPNHNITQQYFSGELLTGYLAHAVQVPSFADSKNQTVLLSLLSKDDSIPYCVSKIYKERKIVLIGDLFTEGGAAGFFRQYAPEQCYPNRIYDFLINLLYWIAQPETAQPFGVMQLVHTKMAAIVRLDGDHCDLEDQAEATLDYLTDLAHKTGVTSMYSLTTDRAAKTGWDFFKRKFEKLLAADGSAASHSRFHEIEANPVDFNMTETDWFEEIEGSLLDIREGLKGTPGFDGDVPVFINPGNTLGMDQYDKIALWYDLLHTHGFEEMAPIAYGRSTWFVSRDNFAVINNSPCPDYQWFNYHAWSYTIQQIVSFEETIIRHYYDGIGRGVLFSEMWHDYSISDHVEFVEKGRIANASNRGLYDGARSLFKSLDIFAPTARDLTKKIILMADGILHWKKQDLAFLDGEIDITGRGVSYASALAGMGIRIENTGRKITAVWINGKEHFAFTDSVVILPLGLHAGVNTIQVGLDDAPYTGVHLVYSSKPFNLETDNGKISLSFDSSVPARFSFVVPSNAVIELTEGALSSSVRKGTIFRGELDCARGIKKIVLKVTYGKS